MSKRRNSQIMRRQARRVLNRVLDLPKTMSNHISRWSYGGGIHDKDIKGKNNQEPPEAE